MFWLYLIAFLVWLACVLTVLTLAGLIVWGLVVLARLIRDKWRSRQATKYMLDAITDEHISAGAKSAQRRGWLP